MSTRIGNESILNVVFQEMSGAAKNLLSRDLHGFQAPFSERRFLLITVDAGLALAATLIVLLVDNRWLGHTMGVRETVLQHWYWFPILLAGWSGLAWLNDLYHIPTAHDRTLTLMRLLTICVMGALTLAGVVLIMPTGQTILFGLLAWLLTTLFVAAWRLTYLGLSDAFLPVYQRVLIVGSGVRSCAITEVLEQSKTLHYEILGYVDHSLTDKLHERWSSPVLGKVDDLPRLVEEKKPHQVIVATEDGVDDPLFSALVHCQATGTTIAWMPDLYEKLCHRIPVQYIDPAWGVYAIQDRPIFRRLSLVSKRFFDLALFLLALPVFILVFPILALAIKLDSEGPVFYRQVRCGRGGMPFRIYKFRTMVTHAEKDGKARWASKNDSRITRVGRFLRKTRLDELPQIVNVLRGEMSFVGPRPERPEFVTELEQVLPYYSTRMLVKPGLTGWAQIHYDYGNTVEDAMMKLQYDFYYVRHWSIWVDIYILFRTVAVVVQLKGM